MILTRLTAVGTDGSRVMLWFDDGSRTRVPASLVTDRGLYGGMELTEEDLERLMDAARLAAAKSQAVRIVSSASVSEKELRRRLVRKGQRPQDAAAAVEHLRELGAIDDGAVARQVVSRCVSRGYGINRARQTLAQKGVPREYWEEALADYPDMSEEIDRFLERRLRDRTPDRESLQKAAAALSRRGYDWSDISAGLRRYQKNL